MENPGMAAPRFVGSKLYYVIFHGSQSEVSGAIGNRVQWVREQSNEQSNTMDPTNLGPAMPEFCKC